MNFRPFLIPVLFLICFASASAEAPKISVGIAPVFDGGGEDFGPIVVQHLTLFTYQDLLNSTIVHPNLLSPGGVYSPLDTSWLVDYVHDRPEISLLVVATLKPIAAPVKGRWAIPIEVNLLDAQSGDTISTWTVSEEIDSHKTLLEYGEFAKAAPGMDRYDKYGQIAKGYMIAASRDFEKQPLGKACAHLASQIKDTLEAKIAAMDKMKTQSLANFLLSKISFVNNSASCAVNFHITYGYKHSASHSYDLMANGLDQSTNLNNGVATFQAPEGELLLQFAVNDAPYKLVKESQYQFSTLHSCKNTDLTLDLGPGGDVHAHWN
jgi:hypothetical protein